MNDIESKNCENNKHNNCMLKYPGIICATLLGSFLAFYVVTDLTFNRIFSPAYAYNNIDKINKMVIHDFEKMDKDFDKITKHEMIYNHKSAIEFIKTPDSYKFIIDLSPFQGNPDDIKVDIKDNTITISGESTYNKNNVESFTKMSQTYTLSNKANTEKLSKKKVDNQYIITIPIED